MTNTVTLTLTDGNQPPQTQTFEERSTCLIGRHPDCNLQLPDDEDHKTISRYHCLLDINPPHVSVRDFGSLNGTYLNGNIIGQRQPSQTAEAAREEEYPVHDLKSSDTIKLGQTETTLQIAIEQSPQIAETVPIVKKVANDDASTIANNEPHPQYLQLLRAMIQQAATEQSLIAIKGYDVEKRLGRGGFGEVYLARHQQTGEQVAIKVMLPDVATHQNNVQRFLDEAAKTKALNHPNIVQLKDCGYSEGVFFFTLEYCDGGSVDRLVHQRGGRLTIPEAMPIICQTLDGLHYAHNAAIAYKQSDGTFKEVKGLVHRDISPQNIFLAKSGDTYIAKLGDYGLAKAFEATGLTSRTSTGMVGGKPVYMPRQQLINFKRAKPEVDIWAVAASLYTMLAGEPPRNFTQGQDPFLIVLKTDPIPIRERKPDIPKALAEVIDLALKDNPKLHFQDALSFKKALETAV